jgi:hypothetical protein
MYSCSVLGCNSWEFWCIQLFHITVIKWHDIHHSESWCAVKFQVWSIPINKTTPTWSVLLPLLSTFLPYHTHWENNTPTSASTLPTRHLCDTTECVKSYCQMSHCILLLGSKAFIKEFLLCQVSEFTVFRICVRYENYLFEIMVVDRCYGGSSRKTQDVFISEHIELQRVHLCGN